jgi:hypothetical protein
MGVATADSFLEPAINVHRIGTRWNSRARRVPAKCGTIELFAAPNIVNIAAISALDVVLKKDVR